MTGTLGKWWKFAARMQGFPFTPARARTPVERLRALRPAATRAIRAPYERAIADFAGALLWPAAALVRSVRAAQAHRNPAHIARALRMAGCALAHNIAPEQYRRLVVAGGIAPRDLRHHVLPADVVAYSLINARAGADPHSLQDKARFAEICRNAGLAHPRVYAAYRGGQALVENRIGHDRPACLFVKALDGWAGRGVGRWMREGAVYRDDQGLCLTVHELSERLLATDCVVQELLEDHPDLNAHSGLALSNLRVVTGRMRSGKVVAISAILTLASDPDAVTAHRGTVVALDLASGRARCAYDTRDPGFVTTLPFSGAPLETLAVPDWAAILDLVARAHGAFTGFMTVAWDLAVTARGAVLLEGNIAWSPTLHQRLDGPLGLGPFAEILNDHLGPHHHADARSEG